MSPSASWATTGPVTSRKPPDRQHDRGTGLARQGDAEPVPDGVGVATEGDVVGRPVGLGDALRRSVVVGCGVVVGRGVTVGDADFAGVVREVGLGLFVPDGVTGVVACPAVAGVG